MAFKKKAKATAREFGKALAPVGRGFAGFAQKEVIKRKRKIKKKKGKYVIVGGKAYRVAGKTKSKKKKRSSSKSTGYFAGTRYNF